MVFQVSRTTNRASDISDPCPCVGAHQVPMPIYSNDDGINVNPDYCEWFIEIRTLEELDSFSREHGDIVINTRRNPSIEIYDDYRE